MRRRSPFRRAYPFVVSVYLVLYLAANNSAEWLHLWELLVPILVSLGLALLSWCTAALLTKDPDKRAFLACVGVVLLAGYGYFAPSLVPDASAGAVAPEVAVLALIGALGVYAIACTLMAPFSFARVSDFLSSMAIILFTFASVTLAVQRMDASRPHSRPLSIASGSSATRHPTIYLIILDKYTGARSLLAHYGFNNEPFEQALRNRGFFVPRSSRANYVLTRLALPSLLNWEYLDSIARLVGPSSRNWSPLYAMAEDNRGVALLKQAGYEFVFFPTWYRPSTSNRHADLQLPEPGRITPQFQTVWLQTTALSPLLAAACRRRPCAQRWAPESTSLLDWKFAQLGELAGSTNARFVLAHLIVPHEPYVYHADCSHRTPLPLTIGREIARAAYIEQIQCVNQKILSVVDRILMESPVPPVILLQSDHGHGQFGESSLEISSASKSQIRERSDIFAAYLVPGASDTLFYDAITPVNVLPAVLNTVLGTAFPRLPDRTYWSTLEEPYRFTVIP